MMKLIYMTFLILAIITLISSSSSILTLPIEGQIEIPSGESVSNIHVQLNQGEYTCMSRSDGSFTFHDIPTGIYLLDVLSIRQVFSKMKIKVSAEEGSVNVVEFKYPGAIRNQASK